MLFRESDPFIFLAWLDCWYTVRQHQGLHIVASCRLASLSDGAVVIQNIQESLAIRQNGRELFDHVVTNHGLHIDVGVQAQIIKSCTRNGVSGQRSNFAVMFNAESDARINGTVIGCVSRRSK